MFYFSRSKVNMPTTKTLLLTLLQASMAMAQDQPIQVQVGAGGNLTFTPDSVSAKLGDVIEFQFLSHNHTVTQGDPSQGCTPAGSNSYDSGFVYVTDRNSTVFYNARQTTLIGTFTIPVKTTNTMFFYCAQANHCQADSMVFAVNPTVYSTRSVLRIWLSRRKGAGYTSQLREPLQGSQNQSARTGR
jgi:plastocyanin